MHIYKYFFFLLGYQQMNNIITNILPKSCDELHCLNDNIPTQETEFIEVSTRSPRLSQLKSVIPVFLIPGFRPKLIKTFYEQLSYPVFEAKLPENISSIDEISLILVNVRSIDTLAACLNITDLIYI